MTASSDVIGKIDMVSIIHGTNLSVWKVTSLKDADIPKIKVYRSYTKNV